MQRRHFLGSALLASGLSPFLFTDVLARQSATPAATPVADKPSDAALTLPQQVAQIEPQTLLDALRSTPVTSPLFPADTPPIEPVVWDDTGDRDLENAVGGVVFNTGYDENDNFLGVGVAIVHPDAESASATMTATGPVEQQAFLGLPWFVQALQGNAVAVVQVDYLLLVGGADPSVFPADSDAMLVLRSITHMTALLDHLDGVLADLMS